MKKSVLVIHGGDTFETYEEYLNFLNNYEIDIERYRASKEDWKRGLRQKLGNDFEVILPSMPNKMNARFNEWKLWFEKFIPFLGDEVLLVGHSLGATFVTKYLSENTFPKKLVGVFLVSGVFDKDSDGGGLVSFTLPDSLDLQTENAYLYHSKDDEVVPFSALEQFKNKLPSAQYRVFEDRGHMNQEEFPELVEDMVNLTK